MDAELLDVIPNINLNNYFNLSNPNEFTSVNNYFNLKFSKLLNTQFIYSPLAITYLTLLFYLGSNGKTKEEIANIFGIDNDIEKIIKLMLNHYKELISEINISNGIFINYDYYNDIKPLYLKLLSKLCGITSCNFIKDNEIIVKKINYWICKSSNNIIKNIISYHDISDTTRLVAINSVCFRSNWKYEFIDIKLDTFTNQENKTFKLDFMNHNLDLYYYENNDLQLVEIPFYHNDLVFGIFLSKNIQNFIETKITMSFDYYIKYLTLRRVKLSIPKFKQRSHYNLQNIFEKLDCKNMFEPTNAEFFNMIQSKEGLHISKFIHDTVIIIDEKGNYEEFIENNIKKINIPVTFNANHTFQYYIRHIPSNIILFHGLYNGS